MSTKRRRHFKGFIKGPRGERGATAVEFALVAPVFLLFVLGIIDLGRLFWVKNLMQYGVGETARWVMVHPSELRADVITHADEVVEGMFTGIIFDADVPGTDIVGGISYRTISASYTFNYMMPFVTLTDILLSASSRTPVNASP